MCHDMDRLRTKHRAGKELSIRLREHEKRASERLETDRGGFAEAHVRAVMTSQVTAELPPMPRRQRDGAEYWRESAEDWKRLWREAMELLADYSDEHERLSVLVKPCHKEHDPALEIPPKGFIKD